MAERLVIIPTYNEKENIEKIINAVFSLSLEFHILVIDDNSPDGTADIVKSLMDTDKYSDKLFIVQRTGKLGLGTAYIEGFKWAIENHYEYIFEMDADFSHNPEDLIRLYDACYLDSADMAIGSRYIKGVNVVNWPISRVLMSYFASIYVRIITGMKVKDATAGFVCYRRRVLASLNLNNITFIGYAFQIEMKYTAWKLGFKILEIPIVFTDRTEGQSKMSKGIFKEAIWGVIKLRFRNIKSKHKKLKNS